MRNKIVIGLTCVFVLLLVTCTAFADSQQYTVYVGGKAMTVSEDGSDTAYFVNGTDGEQGHVYTDEPSTWNAKLWYDVSNATLMLELDNLNTSGDPNYSLATKGKKDITPDIKRCAGIYTAQAVEIIVKGENTVKGVEYDTTYNWNDSGNSIVNKVCDSIIYGVYAKEGFAVSRDSTGKLIVETEDIDGSCYGVYSSGNINILGGELIVNSGDSINISRLWDQRSYGIYAYGLLIGGRDTVPYVTAHAGDSYAESCGIYGYTGITVKSGDVKAMAGYAQKGYSDGMMSNRATILIEGGTVEASSEGGYEGMATGICANELVISGGNINAIGGPTANGQEQSAGIYTNYDIEISGGTLNAKGIEAIGDVSFGINSWRGNITIGGDSTVYAHGGPASYSTGLCAERRYDSGNRAGGNITVKDSAKVYASTDDTDTTRVYSYAMFVGGNLLIEDDAYVEAVAGRVSDVESPSGKLLGREKRSFGIYLADDVYDGTNTNYVEGGHKNTTERHTLRITGGTVIAKTMDSDNGWLPDSVEDPMFNRSYAVVFYDADKIEFSDENQTKAQWYQWKINESDEMTKSTEAIYPDAEEWQSATQYFHVEPISEEEPEQPPVDPEDPDEPDDPTEPGEQDKPDKDPETNTGDDFDLLLMMTIMLITLATMTGVAYVGRRRTQ